MAKNFEMVNSQQNNGTQISHKYVNILVILHLNSFWKFCWAIYKNCTTKKKSMSKTDSSLTDRQVMQKHYTPASPCVGYNNLILPYIIHIIYH